MNTQSGIYSFLNPRFNWNLAISHNPRALIIIYGTGGPRKIIRREATQPKLPGAKKSVIKTTCNTYGNELLRTQKLGRDAIRQQNIHFGLSYFSGVLITF